jgi:hypothetical protein
MPRTIHLKPVQTGDACYLQDHHNRDGECIITVTMTDGAATKQAAEEQILAELMDSRAPYGERGADMAELASVAAWCAAQWQAAQADMPAEVDRDTEGDDSERYLECHILATWEV